MRLDPRYPERVKRHENGNERTSQVDTSGWGKMNYMMKSSCKLFLQTNIPIANHFEPIIWWERRRKRLFENVF